MNSAAEQAAAGAFSKQAVVFDDIYQSDTIIQYKRSRVRQHMKQFLIPGSHILELNAGTGDDAIYFAGKGHTIHATDIAEGMQEKLKAKIHAHALEQRISTELCSFTRLDQLQQRGPYDHIFSNFAGLNCTDQLEQVLQSMHSLVKPGGFVTLVILPAFCTWEILLLFRGKFRTAFRRFAGRKGARAHIEGNYFRCWYYQPSFVKKILCPHFTFCKLEGLCTIVPPSYMEGFAEKHPKLYPWLVKKENRMKDKWPWRSTGDYYIITMQKNAQQ
ncbi:MAG: methyltransferase domain-containing protein [Bacteroidetes bacterium]|nr:methyltransferase domain-containing protein [Bacteroidota bacterium]